jgi:GT2 family glycosyltransferase
MTEMENCDQEHRVERRLPPEIEYYLNITGLQHLPEVLGADSPALTGLQPEQAGLLQVFPWTERSSVLFWNWPGLVAARALIDDGHEVYIYDERESYRAAARALCGEEAQVSGFSDPESETLTPIVNLQRLDKIFISTPMLDKIGAEDPLIRLLVDTLNRGGTVIVAQTNATSESLAPLLFSEGLSVDSLRSETVLAMPDLETSVFLLREAFLYETPGAWKHLAGYIDEAGNRRTPGTLPIREVWEMFEQYQRFPINKLPGLEVLDVRRESEEPQVQTDFVYQAVGQRNPAYWTESKKARGEALVQRRPIVESATSTSSPGANNEAIQHVLTEEQYRSGRTVDDLWLSALSADDISELLELVEQYFSFLTETIQGQDRPVVDLLLDNLVTDHDGNIFPIDQEWRCRAELLDPESMFCRGIVYFLSRNALVLDRAPAVRQWGSRHRDLLTHLCNAVGIAPDTVVVSVERFERLFRSEALQEFGVIEVSSLLERRFGDQETIELAAVLDFSEDQGVSHIVVPFPAASGRTGCAFQFRFPSWRQRAETLSIVFPTWLGVPRIESLSISNIAEGEKTILVDYQDPGKIRHICKGIGSAKLSSFSHSLAAGQLGGVMLLLPSCGKAGLLNDTWDVDLRVAWPEMIYGPDAEERFLGRLWAKEEALQEVRNRVSGLERQVSDSRESLNLRSAELELLKSSKAWRVAELLRKIFFSWRRSRDEVRNLTAIEQLVRKASPPRERSGLICDDRHLRIAAMNQDISVGPVICVIIPVHNTPKPWLADAVNSIRHQTYPHWQLLLVNDGSTEVGTREFLDNLDDPKITKIQLTRSVGISIATQTGVDAAHGDFIALMDHDDMLAPDALEKVAKAIQEHRSDVIYTDETTFSDRTQEKQDGYLGLPHLKPAYSPDLLLSHNYITHLLVIRKEIIDRAGGFRPEFDGAQDYDLLLRVTEQTDKIFHLPEPLYHWRQSAQSTSLDTGAKPLAHLRGQKALLETLERRKIPGEVLTANAPHFFRVRREILGRPFIDVIIPFRDQPLMLKQCIDALISNTRYDEFRVLGVDNGSVETLTLELKDHYERETERVRFVALDEPFNFSQIVNFGVKHAKGEHVVLMNNDIQVINCDWLEAMLEHSQRSEIGAVGAKLYYPDDTIQHAGIAIGIGSYAGHPHKHVEGGFSGYLNRLHNIQNVSAVTGAMMMVKREVYEAVGGFDEHLFKIACNDVDFCLRLRNMGLLNLFTPYARAYHHESVSRGYEDTPEKKIRFEGEVEAFQKRHAEALSVGDPYYNRHFRLDTEEVLAQPWVPNKSC